MSGATDGVGSDWVGIVFGPATALRTAYGDAIDEVDGWSLDLAALARRVAPLIGGWTGSWPHHHAVLAVDRLRIDHADLAWRLEWILQTEAQPVAGVYSLPNTSRPQRSMWDMVIDVALLDGEERWSGLVALAPMALHDANVGRSLIESLGPGGLFTLVEDAIELLALVELSHDQATSPLVWGEPSGPMMFEGFAIAAADVDVMVDALGVLVAAASMANATGLISTVEQLDDEQLGQLLAVMRTGIYDVDFLVAVGHRLAAADPVAVAAALPGGRRWLTGFGTVHADLVDPGVLFLEAVARQPEAAAALLKDDRLGQWLLDLGEVHSGAGSPPNPAPIADLRAEVLQAAFAWAEASGPSEIHRIWNALAPAVVAHGIDPAAARAVGEWLVAHWHLVVVDPTRADFAPAMGAAVVPVLVKLFDHAAVRDAVLAGVVDDAMVRLDLTVRDAGGEPAARIDAGIGVVTDTVRLVWLALAEQAAGVRAADNSFDELVSNVLAVLRILARQAASNVGLSAVPARLLILAANELATELLDGSPGSLPDFDEFLSAVAMAEVQLEPPSNTQLPVPLPVGIQVRFLQILLDARPDLHVLVMGDQRWFSDGQIRFPAASDRTSEDLYDFAVWFQATTSGSLNELTDLFSALDPLLGPG